MKTWLAATILALGILLPRPVHVSSSARPSTRLPNAAQVWRLLAAVNHDRATRRIRPLALNKRLSLCSYGNSRYMASTGSVSQEQFPGDICVRHARAGENVAYWWTASPTTVLQIHRDMMSEGPCPHRGCPGNEYEYHGHYMNLVDPAYRSVGIGIYVTHGTTWVTEDFIG